MRIMKKSVHLVCFIIRQQILVDYWNRVFFFIEPLLYTYLFSFQCFILHHINEKKQIEINSVPNTVSIAI